MVTSFFLGLRHAVLLLALMLSVASPAFAQAEPAAASDEVARGLFQAGRASYDAGNYEDALKYFQQAFDLSQRPGLLYNVGQAADRLHRDAKTIEAFRLYLERVPAAENRAEVEGRLRTLERIVALESETEQAQTNTNATDATATQTSNVNTQPLDTRVSESSGPGIAPWLVIGGSAAVLVTGVVLTIVGAGQISDVEGAERGSAWSGVSSKADSGPTLATTGVVLTVLGAVGAAVGTIWLVGSESEPASTALLIGPGFVGIGGQL